MVAKTVVEDEEPCAKKRKAAISVPGSSSSSSSRLLLLDLPNEIITLILTHLSSIERATKASLVCKRLRELSINPSLWTKLVIPRLTSTSHIHATKRMISRCSPMLESLNLSKRGDSVYLATEALKCCPRLKELLGCDLASCSVESVKRLLRNIKNCDSLRSVELSGKCNVQLVSDSAACLGNLTSVSLDFWNCNSTPSVLEAISEQCKHLRRFELYQSVDTRGLGDRETSVFLDRVSGTIRELVLPADDLTDVSFENVGACHLLKRLRLFDADGLGGRGLSSIASGLPDLQELMVTGCRRLEDSDVAGAFAHREMRSLSKLSLIYCELLADSGLKSIADSCPALEELVLTGCGGVTDAGVRRVMQRCRLLRDLKLQWVGEVTPAAFEEEGAGARLESLVLHRTASFFLSEAERETIFKLVPSLKSINFCPVLSQS